VTEPARGAIRNRAIRFVIRLLVGASLLGLVVHRIGTPAIDGGIGGRVAAGTLGAALLLAIGQGIAALRWKIVLGGGSPPWMYLARLFYIGTFFSLFLPTAVGGDVVRAAAAARAAGRPGGVVASVIIDRALGFLALVGYGVLGGIIAPEITQRLFEAARLRLPAAWVVVSAAVMLIAGYAATRRALRSPRIRIVLSDAWGALRDLVRVPAALGLAMGLSFIVQGIYIVLWIVLAVTVRLPLEPATLVLGVPIVSAVAMLPVTINGLGVREGAWLLLLGGAGIAHAKIVGFSLLYFAANLLVGMMGGLLFIGLGTGGNGAAARQVDGPPARPSPKG
jgi:uncharacterized membrane protein YbhN (UPF0104 family)